MRTIYFDFSNDPTSCRSVFGGYAGEHNETKLSVKLPSRLISDDISLYKFIFSTSDGSLVVSNDIFQTNGIVEIMLWNQLMVAPVLKAEVAAYELDGDEAIVVGKTAPMTLLITGCVYGVDSEIIDYGAIPMSSTTISSNGHLVAEMIDGTKKDLGVVKGDKGEQGDKGDTGDTGNGITGISLLSSTESTQTFRISYTNGDHFDYTIPTSTVEADISYNPNSYSAQSGVAVAEAISVVEDLAEKGIKELDERVDVLYKLTKGQAWDIVNGTSPAYTQQKPKGSHYVDLKMIGGKSVEWNQLNLKNNYPSTKGVRGIDFTHDSETDRIFFKGTVAAGDSATLFAEFKLNLSHKYFLIGCPEGGSANDSYSIAVWVPRSYETGNGLFFQPTVEKTRIALRLVDGSGPYDGKKYFEPKLFDLTLMFGKDKEPTSITDPRIQFIKDCVSSYPEYNPGGVIDGKFDMVKYCYLYSSSEQGGAYSGKILTSAKLSKNKEYKLSFYASADYVAKTRTYLFSWRLDGKGKSNIYNEDIKVGYNEFVVNGEYDGLLMTNFGTYTGTLSNIKLEDTDGKSSLYEVPEYIQNLDGYGWSAGDVYNYIDFETKTFHKRVGRVNLGELNILKVTDQETYPNVFYIPEISLPTNVRRATSGGSNSICGKYNNAGSGGWSSVWDKSYSFNSNTGAWNFKDSSYTDAATFKASLEGTYMYYELKNEIVEDISEYLTEEANFEVEADSAIQFNQQGGTTFELPNTVDYYRNLSEVLS